MNRTQKWHDQQWARNRSLARTPEEVERDKAAKRAEQKRIHDLLHRYKLSWERVTFDWQRDKNATYIQVTPAGNIPQCIREKVLPREGAKALYGQGFRYRAKDAICFNERGAWSIFLEVLTNYDQGKFPSVVGSDYRTRIEDMEAELRDADVEGFQTDEAILRTRLIATGCDDLSEMPKKTLADYYWTLIPHIRSIRQRV